MPQPPPQPCRTMPCECGSHDAYWHGPEYGLREYACDACWRRLQAASGANYWRRKMPAK